MPHLSRHPHTLKVQRAGYTDAVETLDLPLIRSTEWITVRLTSRSGSLKAETSARKPSHASTPIVKSSSYQPTEAAAQQDPAPNGSGFLPAQTGAPERLSGSTVVVRTGGYRLTEGMIQQALQYGQILASADFSASDAAALRAGLIAYFQKEPAQQMKAYESVARKMQQVGRRPSWLDLAILRYNEWQQLGEPQQFRAFVRFPFGRMLLKYNPILVNSGGMVVTQNDVDCQFYSDTMVAKAAGVTAPTETDKQQFIRNLPSRFASMSTEQKEYLREAEMRLAQFHILYDGTNKTHAAMLADIRKNVRSSTDVSGNARQVETDADSGAIAQQRALNFQTRLYVSQLQFQTKMEAARAQRDAALALDPHSRWVYRPDLVGTTDVYKPFRPIPAGAAGKYWQSFVNESNGARVNNNDGVVTLEGLIKRNAAPQSFGR